MGFSRAIEQHVGSSSAGGGRGGVAGSAAGSPV